MAPTHMAPEDEEETEHTLTPTYGVGVEVMAPGHMALGMPDGAGMAPAYFAGIYGMCIFIDMKGMGYGV